MQQFRSLVEKANQSFQIADHLAYMTYPVVNDVKITITILKNLYFALTTCVEALLYFDRLFKRIGPLPNDFNSKFYIFKTKTAPRYKIQPQYIPLIEEIGSIIQKHDQSPMVFRRKEKFIICTNNYKVQTITINTIKNYLDKTKPFIQQINQILEENERKFDDRKFGR